ncbi:MAG: autotransporter-associated beta strand repeat-containing protein [Candidatus Omnitrophica bacterium]|nr:autotransporter-associated beta strand repeat-containing protein [Candidatus Omnitrophota bacterium]
MKPKRKRKLVLLNILTILLVVLTAHSGNCLPEGESVEYGSATFERPDPATTNNIFTLRIFADDGCVINFNSFSIASNEAVHFIQPSENARVLSRVIGQSPTEIAGILSANGTLFLINPQGICFSPTSQVHVETLVASTLDIATNNFLNANYILENSNVFSAILNQGKITASNVALVGSAVQNHGFIFAQAGSVQLASGNKVTISFDTKGLIQLEVNAETINQVFGFDGKPLNEAVLNTATIEAHQVYMTAQVAEQIFEKAVNQKGIVKASTLVEEGGKIKIKANRNVEISGILDARRGNIEVFSGQTIKIDRELKTFGNTELKANKNVEVYADVTTVNGNLSFLADADFDGIGSFLQAIGTTISTCGFGNILIQSSGKGLLANVNSAGDIILKQSAQPAYFTQYYGSHLTAGGSLIIGQGVTLNAANSIYHIARNWVNFGNFNAQQSSVEFISELPSIISGDNVFYNLQVIAPGKKITVEADKTVTVMGSLTIQGCYANLVTLVSTEPGKQWKILPLADTDIAYAQIGDCFNARGPPLIVRHSTSVGNNTNVDIRISWIGEGETYFWSDPANWDTGTVPSAFDVVFFNGLSTLNSHKDSFVDPNFKDQIAGLVIDGYRGIITLGRSLAINGDILLSSGCLQATNQLLSIAGSWINTGGIFEAGKSTVIFFDSTRPSFIFGNNSFYNLTCTSPSKELLFEPGSVTTIMNILELEGAYGKHIKLLSQEKGKYWYIDPKGVRLITYTWVEDSYNLNSLIVKMTESTNRGNCYNWDPTATWTGAISEFWSVAGNWTGLGGATPGAGDDLVFPSGVSRLNTYNDLTANTSFNSITITGSGYTLAGNPITLGAGGITTNISGGTNTISLNITLSETRTVTVTNSNETLTISGVISGSAGRGLIKQGQGTLVLGATNTYQGATTINSGTLRIWADSALGQPPASATPGHLTFGGGTLLTTASFTLNANRGIALSSGGGIIDVTSSTVLTYAGVIAGANPLEKRGGGEIVLQGVNTNSSTVTLNGGIFTLSGANGTMTSATFIVNQGAILNLDNSTSGTNNTNRLSDSNAFTLSGGELIFRGTNTPSTNATEIVGMLTLPSGASKVTVFSGTGGQTILTFAGASRSAGATVLFRGTNLGANPQAGNTNIRFTNAAGLNLTGAGGAAGTTSINIIPYAFGDTSATGTGISFVTHNVDTNGNTNGIRPLNLTTEYTQNAFTTNTNVRITVATNFTTNATINSLLIDGNTLTFNTNTRTLTVSSGAVARVSNGDIASSTATSRILAFGNVEGVIWAIGSFNFAPVISGTAGITISGGGTVTFPSSNAAAKTYTGTTTINEGGLTVNLASGIATSSVITVAAPATFTKGDVSLTIASLNLYSGNTAGAQVVLGINALTLGGNITVNLNGTGAVGSTIYTASTGSIALSASRTVTVADGLAENDLTIAVVISGTGYGVTKEGTGTLLLSKANTYTGLTAINAGKLLYGITDTLSSGNVTVNNGAVFDWNSFSDTIGALTVNDGGIVRCSGNGATLTVTSLAINSGPNGGGVVATGQGSLQLNGNVTSTGGSSNALISGNLIMAATRTFTLTNSTDGLTISAVISGAGGLTKAGNGTLTLTGLNTFTGAVTINAGTVVVNSLANTGSASSLGTGTSAISMAASTVLRYIGTGGTTDRSITLTGSGVTIVADGTGPIIFTGGVTGSTYNLILDGSGEGIFRSGVIAITTGSITKNGIGIWTLDAANTYTGVTTVNEGTMVTTILRNGGVASSIGASSNAATNLVLNAGTFKYTGPSTSTDRLFTVGTSGTTLDVSGEGTLTFTGTSINLSGTNVSRTLIFTGTGSGVFSPVITDNGTGVTSVVKNGSGTWFFTAVNTYTGTTIINEGALKIKADSGLGTAPVTPTPSHLILNGGSLRTLSDFTLNANRGILLSKTGAIYVEPGTTLTYAGVIAGANSLEKHGQGTLILQGVNTYSGETTVKQGTLVFSAANGSALDSTSFTIHDEATLILDNSSASNLNRIADTATIKMYGGSFTLIGSNTSAVFETVGPLQIQSGLNYVNVRDSTKGATVITFASLARTEGAIVVFRGKNLGSASGANVATIMFTNAPVLSGAGGAAGTPTVSIIKGAFGSDSLSSAATDMVTYNFDDNPFGLRLLNSGGYSNEYATSLSVPNANVKLTSAVAPVANITINSLILTSSAAIANSSYTLTITSGNVLALEGNAGINASTVLAFGTSSAVIYALGNLNISSQITGSGGLTVAGAGLVTLSNSTNNFTGGIRITEAIIRISEDQALGAGTGDSYLNLFAGTLRTSSSFTLNANRGIFLSGTGTIYTDTGTTLTYNGIITGEGSLIKDGDGSLLLGGNNSFVADLTVNAGSLTLTGVNSYLGTTTINRGTLTLSGSNGTALNCVSFVINSSGSVIVDNSAANNTNRIGNSSSIILRGGEFVFKGTNVSATNAAETIGMLEVAQGASKVTVFSGTGGSTVLTFGAITRDTGATVLFRGNNIGSNPAAGNTNIIFVDPSGLYLVGANTSATNKPIVPYAFGDNSVSGLGTGFVTYNINITDNGPNSNGIRLLDLATEYTQNTLTAGTNVRITSATNAASSVTINSILINGADLSYSANCTLTVTSGAVGRVSTGNIGATASSTSRILQFGYAEGIIFAIGSFYISPAIAGSGGLTISGSGTVEFPTSAASYYGAVKSYTAVTTINEGGLTINLANAIANTSVITVAPNATFTLGNVALTITTLNLYSGSTNAADVVLGAGTLTLLSTGAGSINLFVNGLGAVGSTITTSSSGSIALGASRVITVEDGSANDDLTISVVISGTGFGITKAGLGTLVLSGNNTYTGANVINGGTLAVTVNNALGTNAGNTTVNNATIDFRNVSYSTTEPLILAADSKLICSTGTSSFAGAITMTGTSTIEVKGAQLSLSGTINNGGYRLTVDGTGNTIISNTFTDTGGGGAGSLDKLGTGTLTFSGTVNFEGSVSILAGALTLTNNTLTVSGDWLNKATFNCGTSTVIFSGSSATVDTGGTGNGRDFYKVIINATGTKTFAGPVVINNVLQVDVGTLASDYNITVKGGSVTSSGVGIINVTGGTFTVQGTGNFGGSSNAWNFFNLTFGDGSTVATTTKTGTNTINVNGTLEVKFNHTLQAGNATTWNLVWKSYLVNIRAIASGYDHTIALTQDGYVFAWGCNFFGQLGDNTTDDASRPVQVLSGEQGGGTYLHNIIRIAAGGYHSIALAEDGTVFAWGYNEFGQLGNGSTENSATPVQVHGLNNEGVLSNISKIAAGGFNSAAVSSTGFVYTWGYNGEGELGNGTTQDSYYPVQVLSGEQGGGTYLHDIATVAVGGAHMLALTTDGYVYAWGFNEDGQLGNGSTINSATAVRVLSGEQGAGTYLHNITRISAGDSHSLALSSDGYVFSWGYNNYGQLGDGTTFTRLTAVRVLAGVQGGTYLRNVTDIAAGGAHSLAIADGGYVYSWGQNQGPNNEPWGQLGDGTTINRYTPVKVLAGEQGSETYLHDIVAIAAGGAQTVALSQARPVFNCGNNANGQLGKGDFTVSAVEQIRVLAGSQVGPVIQIVITGTLVNQTATINIYLASTNYTNLTISNRYQANYWLSGNTFIAGNLIIEENAILRAGSYTLTVSGNWTNLGGLFDPGTGKVILNSSTQTQTVRSGGSSFNILTITNTYEGGVAFVDRLVTAYLNAGPGVKKLSFSAASASAPHTITTGFNVSGSAGRLIELAPIVPEMMWYLSAPQTTLSYLKIGYSHQADGKTIIAIRSQDLGGNVNWDIRQ